MIQISLNPLNPWMTKRIKRSNYLSVLSEEWDPNRKRQKGEQTVAWFLENTTKSIRLDTLLLLHPLVSKRISIGHLYLCRIWGWLGSRNHSRLSFAVNEWVNVADRDAFVKTSRLTQGTCSCPWTSSTVLTWFWYSSRHWFSKINCKNKKCRPTR